MGEGGHHHDGGRRLYLTPGPLSFTGEGEGIVLICPDGVRGGG